MGKRSCKTSVLSHTHLLLLPVVVAESGNVAEAGGHALELVLELLDLVAHAPQQRVLLGDQVPELPQEHPHGAMGCADRRAPSRSIASAAQPSGD